MALRSFLVNLSGLANADEIYKRIDFFAFETFPVVGKPKHYKVYWEEQESINSLIPDLPAERIISLN